LGLATAIRDGMKLATGKYIAVMDADLQHPPEVLVNMYSAIQKGNDMVIASRYMEGGSAHEFSFFRKLVSKGATFIAHLMIQETKTLTDPMSGFFIFKKDIIDQERINSSGYKILLEILVKGSGTKLVEVPYTFNPRMKGKSKLGITENLNYLKLVFSLSGYRPLKFVSVGITGILVNEGILYLIIYSGLFHGAITHPIFAAIPAIEFSILSNFIINNFWTFGNRRKGHFLSKIARYNGFAGIGGMINYVAFVLLAYGIPFNYLALNLLAIIFGVFANYIFSEMFVWPKEGGRESN
jgi:dolichol-phosphate mannosyltransferase